MNSRVNVSLGNISNRDGGRDIDASWLVSRDEFAAPDSVVSSPVVKKFANSVVLINHRAENHLQPLETTKHSYTFHG